MGQVSDVDKSDDKAWSDAEVGYYSRIVDNLLKGIDDADVRKFITAKVVELIMIIKYAPANLKRLIIRAILDNLPVALAVDSVVSYLDAVKKRYEVIANVASGYVPRRSSGGDSDFMSALISQLMPYVADLFKQDIAQRFQRIGVNAPVQSNSGGGEVKLSEDDVKALRRLLAGDNGESK